MGTKVTAGSNLALGDNWETLVLDTGHLDAIAELIKAAPTQPVDTHTIAKAVAGKLITHGSPGQIAPRQIKRYDFKADYVEGERVFVDNRYGKSFATITQIIRQPVQAAVDKAFLEFDDPDYRERWEEQRSTPYFAINSGRGNAAATYVDASDPDTRVPAPVIDEAMVAGIEAKVEAALEASPRFIRADEGWRVAPQSKSRSKKAARPHISAEPGGRRDAPGPAPVTDPNAALSQGCYKEPLLEAIDKEGEATIDDIKKNIQSRLTLGPADWEMDKTGKIVWIHRLHAAIKHLKRVGAIASPRREVYTRANAQETA